METPLPFLLTLKRLKVISNQDNESDATANCAAYSNLFYAQVSGKFVTADIENEQLSVWPSDSPHEPDKYGNKMPWIAHSRNFTFNPLKHMIGKVIFTCFWNLALGLG